MGQWIPVDERLPPEETRVLATDGKDVFDSEYMRGNWEWCADVTHWMPLPEPPDGVTKRRLKEISALVLSHIKRRLTCPC